MKTPDETKRALVTCTELVMPKEVQHQAMLDSLSLIQQLETANAELLTKVKQLETDVKYHKDGFDTLLAECEKLERERDAAVECIGKLMVILKTYPYAATNGCAYQAYREIQEYVKDMRGVKEE